VKQLKIFNKYNMEQIIRENRGTVVDVRSYEEYSGGHVAGSKNIPLPEIQTRMEELKSLEQPLILCCASGGRSGMAQQMLSAQGMECYNGGSWMNVNYLKAQTL
jgi:rhodanese-related sulfurtransferase